ncbi:uncharacterized protein [Physcomitrium patens]|uniref:Uncharacterized protein n=1 Tax=Physcomitrium patens TaxID=3218 RepID=A0A2K1J3E4_PHYPA|nr:uncharacterized protein LOC112294307 isoform X3 [Physcomitrium patens]PNR36046.1 hypothetical protein PHYPA_021896 [Physcomitrium patens]|eukprot:XP_024400367.1 uncharacterized protein LOC112294307 isoform X3 [Physcomitrella patens]
MAPFPGANQSAMRKPTFLDGTEEHLKGNDEVGTGGPSSDRKPMSFNPFRGHRRVSSGNIITSCKSVESTLREKGRSSSFRTTSSENPPMENGKILSLRTDKYSVAKIAASLIQSPGKIESSVSISRLSHRTLPEQVISSRQQFHVAPDHKRDAGGDKEKGCDDVVKNTEEMSISGGKKSLPFTEDAASGLPSVHSGEFRHGSESIPSCNLTLTDQLSSCINKSNPRKWVLNSFPSNVTPDNPILLSNETRSVHGANSVVHETCSDMGVSATIFISQSQPSHMDADGDLFSLATSTAVSSLSSQQSSTQNSFHLDPERVLKLPLKTDSPEASMIDIQALLLANERVTEAELTEAAVRSSIKGEDVLSDPTSIFEDSQQSDVLEACREIGGNQESPPAMRNELAYSKRSCHFDACLGRTVSFEPGSGPERMKNFRMRRRSISASVHGAMLLKAVSESHSGPWAMKGLSKVGPVEIISGEEALRAREYVLRKTSQISMGRASESFRSPKSTLTVCPESKAALRSESDDRKELVQHSRDAHVSVESTVASLISDACSLRNMCLPCRLRLTYMRLKRCHEDYGVASTCETQKRNYHEEVRGHHLDVIKTGTKYTCIHEGITATFDEAESCSRERILGEANSNFQDPTSDDKYKCTNTSEANSVANEDGSFGKPKRTTDPDRTFSDFDSSTEGLSNSNSNSGPLGQAPSSMDANEAITRARSRSLVSSLHSAPLSETASVDTLRLGFCSGNIYANSSFSSSHQDRLWEEQADIYSSGGRGTPGRGFETAATTMSLHDAPPQVFTASGSLRRGLIDPTGRDPPFTPFAVNRHQGRQQRGNKRGRPRGPLRSLLTDDVHKMGCGTRHPEGSSHFIQQIMQKIRGKSSTSLSPKSTNATTKRRNTWSSCVWFSIK